MSSNQVMVSKITIRAIALTSGLKLFYLQDAALNNSDWMREFNFEVASFIEGKLQEYVQKDGIRVVTWVDVEKSDAI